MDQDMVYETHQRGDLTVHVVHDPEGGWDPREGDNLMEIVHWHRRYDFGERAPDGLDGIEGVRKWLVKERKALNVLPLMIYDHSGVTLWVGDMPRGIPGEHVGWDTGQVGFIYTTQKQIDLLGAPADSIDRQLRAEVKEWDDFMTGNIYGFVIEDKDGEELERGGGCIGDPRYALEEADGWIKWYRQDQSKLVKQRELEAVGI